MVLNLASLRIQQTAYNRHKAQPSVPASCIDHKYSSIAGTIPKLIASESESVLIEQAKKRVSLQLILAEIIKLNDLKADPKKVREMVEHAASGYEDPKSVVDWYYSDQKNLAEVEMLVLEDNVIDWVLEHSNVVEKKCSFDDIMNKRQTA